MKDERIMTMRHNKISQKQGFNPYLPFSEYIPDGEPHVFGDRLYVYGSHDREGGDKFCELDYVVWSAPVDDLTDWRYEGVSYRAEQDPGYGTEGTELYAPDVVRGNDGRYYLYYAMAGIGNFTAPIHAAVSDSPAGPFVYHGCVRTPDGAPLTWGLPFDPGVINDNGVIRLYYGWSLAFDPAKLANRDASFDEWLIRAQVFVFNKSEEEVRGTPGGVMGANTVELEDDMLTVRGVPRRIVPGQADADGTSFDGHAFFEASSIRKIDGTYYFIYSSQWQHELCYATSRFPDRDFVYRGVLVSNGDVGLNGRALRDRLAATGNNHGSIECVNGQWYVFYHRQTHGTTYSRQGCAEPISLLPDGAFCQAEMTSCGLNGGPLRAEGTYSAMIACNLTNGHMPHVDPEGSEEDFPYITHGGQGRDAERFITNIKPGTRIVFKYFAFSGPARLTLTTRGGGGHFAVIAGGEQRGEITIPVGDIWTESSLVLDCSGNIALELRYEEGEPCELLSIRFDLVE